MNPGEPSPLLLLIRRLAQHCALTDADRDAMLALPGAVRTVGPASYLIREGDKPQQCGIIVEGFAYRHKLTREGARQIVGLLIPGEALDFQTLFLEPADHNVQALTRCRLLFVPAAALQTLFADRPAVARAIVTEILVAASIGREWLLNVGRRNARTRLAHLLCEFALRMDAHGEREGHGYELPMTQEQLGDALGLTAVHVNRTLKALEREGVVTRRGRRVQFADWRRMQAIAEFSPLYLHLGSRRDLTNQHD